MALAGEEIGRQRGLELVGGVAVGGAVIVVHHEVFELEGAARFVFLEAPGGVEVDVVAIDVGKRPGVIVIAECLDLDGIDADLQKEVGVHRAVVAADALLRHESVVDGALGVLFALVVVIVVGDDVIVEGEGFFEVGVAMVDAARGEDVRDHLLELLLALHELCGVDLVVDAADAVGK